jgi:predicted secreted protein
MGGGTQLPMGHSSANGRRLAEDDPQLVDTTRDKGEMPGKPASKPPANAVKLAERARKAIAFLMDRSTTAQAARDYWTEREDAIAEIEAAMPAEYARMLDVYNECLDRGRIS